MGMKKRTEKLILNTLGGLNLDQVISNYFLTILNYIRKNKINKLDINLTSDIFPMLSEEFGIKPTTIETKLVKALRHSFDSVGSKVYFDVIKYEKRISIRKLIVILIDMIEKEEEKKVK